MANLICVRLNKGDAPSWGFRLQGGKDFGTPLVVQKVIGGSPAERAGLIAGDTVIKINNTDVFNLRHKDAQDVILRAGNAFDVAIQRGGSTWKPSVTPVGSISAPRPAAPISNNISPVTHTSLAANRQESIGAIGTGHNVSAKPYHQVNGGPKLVNKQYNSPLPIYSEQSIAETLSAQTEVLANGVLGVNFKKNEKSYNAANSEVFRMVQEADKEPRDYEPVIHQNFYATHSHAIGGQSSAVRTTPTTDHVNQEGTDLQQSEPDEKSSSAANQQITKCSDCDRVIVGVFVRIKDKNLHVECFKCATCGTSLKNIGYYNLNNKLYCDVHAKLAARNNPPAPNLQPITIPPGGKIPSGTISAALSSHSLPSPLSLSPNTNYSAAPYQPGPTYSAPKPFSSVTAPLSPSAHTHTPLSPTSTPYTVQNIVWPPIPNEPEIPTASPLYFPPPSQVQPHQKLLLDSTELISQERSITTEEEMSFMNEFSQERNMSLCLSEVYNITDRRSAMECSETISDTIDRQILVESIVQSRPKSPPPLQPKPQSTPGDVNVTFTISEAQLKQTACHNVISDNKEMSSNETLPCNTISDVVSKQEIYKNVSSDVSEFQEVKTCLKETQSQSLASMYEKKIKVENTVPHKWESSMLTALTVASDKPYINLTEIKEQVEPFSEIPTTTSHSALASALIVAPAVPFTPASAISLEPISLPKETIPYFPPEHPIIPKPKESNEEKKEKKTSKKVYGKQKEEVDRLFQDLPAPSTERISMLAALTTAPDRPYSPFNADAPASPTTTHEEATSKTETVQEIETQKKKLVTGTKSLEDYSFFAHTSKPILKTYVPYSAVQSSELTNSCTTTSKLDDQNITKQEFVKSLEDQALETLDISKNVHSSENITNICAGLPPMIQVVRSTFETGTDKVQMEMSCQYLGENVPQTQIIERHSTTDVNKQKAIAHQTTEKHKTTSEITHKKDEEKTVHSKSQQKSIASNAPKELQTQLQKVEATSNNVAPTKINRADPPQVTESLLLQKPTSNFQSENQNAHFEQVCTNKAPKEPITVLQPGESNLNIPQISFQPVIEDLRGSTTFSPRPRSLTPSMINKPAPILPYYQASLVATECAPVGTNLFDPKSPAISRSPSPCVARPLSPFVTPSAAARPVSPAQGPPTNPFQAQKSVYEIEQEGKMQDARTHLQTYIPQHQSKILSYNKHTQKEAGLAESSNKNTEIKQNVNQADLSETSKIENTSIQSKRNGNIHIERKMHVTEEYEHQQRSKVIEFEQLSSNTRTLTNVSVMSDQATAGFHVTNPQPLKSPFRGIESTLNSDTQSKIPKRIQQADSSAKTNCSTANQSASASVSSAKVCSNKNITKPTVSQPNIGTGGGRQAGAIGVAPKRGRGVLNLAATPGSRVPLCAQCSANIRGPFITALGKIWCPDHFICATPSCRRPLHDLGFVEEHGQLYCEYCFEQYLAPPCSKCNAKIKGDCLKAIGRNFHPECFNCVYCGKLFGNSPFFLEDAQPYCETDWNELFTTKCFACGFPVEAGDRWVEALNNNYHSQCFNCTMCKKNLEGQSFFAKGGRPFCKNHAR